MTVHVQPQMPARKHTIAFVGDAPDEEEPLSGQAGRIFNSMLRSAGLDRKDFLITNVYDEKAEDNDTTAFRHDPELTERNFARLAAELAEAQPNVIVPLGGETALWAFTGASSITPYRGSVTPATRIVPGAKLLPTFHPAFIIRQWKFLPIVVGDFIKAAKEADRGPKIVYPRRSLWIEPNEADVADWVDKCKATDLLSVDIETGWHQITCISFAPDALSSMCIPFVDMRKPDRSYWRTPEAEQRVWSMVKELLESPVPKLGQNFTYDTYWLLNKMNIKPMNYRHDTRLMHHALYPELPKDLAFLGGTYTNIGAWKQWGGRHHNDKRDS